LQILAESALKSHKYRPTAYDLINFTDLWDIESDSINSKKRQLLSKISAEIPRPEVNYDPNQIADKTLPIPLDYYINDDGFWDEYIAKKEVYRSTVQLPQSREHYKH
jgi:hypothetical protein